MNLINQLLNYVNYTPSNDIINLLGNISDESNAISSNYVNKYLDSIYDTDSYIASKIYNYDKVNKPIYQLNLGLTLINQIDQELILPYLSVYTSQDGTQYLSAHPLLIDTFNQVLGLTLIRGELRTQIIDSSTLVDSEGKYNLPSVANANYKLGTLVIDDITYEYNEYSPYSSELLSYSIVQKPNGTIYLCVSQPLMRRITSTSNIELSYIVDDSDSLSMNISELSTVYEGVTYKFSSIIISNILTDLPKSDSLDYETLISRSDYLLRLSSVPSVRRCTIYSMSDLILDKAHEVDISDTSGITQMSNDIDLVYNENNELHYVPFYSYFVVELDNYQTLDNLTRNFILNYLTRGLLIKEVLLSYGNLEEVSLDQGNTYNPDYHPYQLAHLVSSKNKLGNYQLYSPLEGEARSLVEFSTPGYQCPDLFIQLVQSRYVSVDISIKLSINYSDANELADIGLQLLTELRQIFNSNKYTYNSTLTIQDIEDLCYQNSAVTYAIVEPFDYARPGTKTVYGVNEVHASPFELLILGKLSLLLDIHTINTTPEDLLIWEDSLTNKLISYEDQLTIESNYKLTIRVSDNIEVTDDLLAGDSIILPNLNLSLVNYVVEVGTALNLSQTIKSAGSIQVHKNTPLSPILDSSDYHSDTPDDNMMNPSSIPPWPLVTDISDIEPYTIIDSSIQDGEIK